MGKRKLMWHHYIYILIDPFTNEVRYVGKTSDIKKRFSEHLSAIGSDVNVWVKELKNKKSLPIIKAVRKTPYFSSKEIEAFYIKFYSGLGHRLFNKFLTCNSSVLHIEIPFKFQTLISQEAFEGDITKEEILVSALGQYFSSDKNEINAPYCMHSFGDSEKCYRCGYEPYFGSDCERYSLDIELKAEKK